MIIGRDKQCVWDYPRPPVLEKDLRTIKVEFSGHIIAHSVCAYKVLETSHPPSFYVPEGDVVSTFFVPSNKQSFCEWKGLAKYWHIKVGSRIAFDAAWSYERPHTAFFPITAYLSFYSSLMDSCFVGEERVSSQEGGFYGGWVTSDIVGPFKGGPGTSSW
jgi:uncharacterized protein (DUF427 family)